MNRAANIEPAPSVISPSEPGRAELLRFYRTLVLIRRSELTTQMMYRNRELPGFAHLYIGQEATAVGVMVHLRQDDWITSTHRGHGHALAKGVPPKMLLAELAGKATGCNGGRGGTMHLYMPSVGLFGTNGLVAGGMPAAVGLAISAKTRGTDQVTVCFFGDGASNHGAFHESLNFAGIQDAPIVFVCENNLYATATPLSMATRNTNIASKSASYGFPGVRVDGNDVLAVWKAAKEAVQRARAGEGPTLIESLTYRQVGHQEGDPVIGWCRTQEEWDEWFKRDPIPRYRNFLLDSGNATEADLKAIEDEVDEVLRDAIDFARKSPPPDPATATLHAWADPINPPLDYLDPSANGRETVVQGWMDAVRDGIAEEMRRDPHIIYFGEGTGDRGGSYGHTKNLFKEFGGGRMIDTPICELGFTGASIGASATGCRAVADLMLADFLFEAGGQIVLQASKLRYMSNGQASAPMVIRAGVGSVKNAGPHHSGSYYPVWAHCPGLIVVVPSNPADAKGLMKTALRASDPVVFLEQKSLLSSKGPVPTGEYYIPFGQAKVVREGTDLTIVSCGLWLQRSVAAAEQLAAQGISAEVIDLRTIVPLDTVTILASVKKTGRLLVVDEAYAMCGVGAEITAIIMEEAFDELDAPVGRLHTEPVSHPFAPILEDTVTASPEKIVEAANAVIEGRPPHQRRPAGFTPKTVAPPPATTVQSADSSSTGILPVAERHEQDGRQQKKDVQTHGQDARATSTPAVVGGVPVIMPNMDLIITEATVVGWFKKVGERVGKGEALLEIETDKAVTSIESPADGVLAEILADKGAVVPLGQQLGTITP
ncbi:MAG: thiamine pyrophosphate-dependent enzyme [Thermoguttaceae bacterium]